MCRQNQLRGMLILGIGIGLLAGCCIESGFWCCALGAALIVLGCVQSGKK